MMIVNWKRIMRKREAVEIMEKFKYLKSHLTFRFLDAISSILTAPAI